MCVVLFFCLVEFVCRACSVGVQVWSVRRRVWWCGQCGVASAVPLVLGTCVPLELTVGASEEGVVQPPACSGSGLYQPAHSCESHGRDPIAIPTCPAAVGRYLMRIRICVVPCCAAVSSSRLSVQPRLASCKERHPVATNLVWNDISSSP